MITPKNPVSRRTFLTATAAFGAAGLAAPALAQSFDPYTGQPLQGAATGATPDAGVVQFDQARIRGAISPASACRTGSPISATSRMARSWST